MLKPRVLEISYEEAEELKNQAIITLKPLGMDFYTLSSGKKFGIKNVNEMTIIAWYNGAVDKNIEMNMYSCLL